MKGSGKFVAIIVAVVLVVALGVWWMSGYSNKQKSDNDAATSESSSSSSTTRPSKTQIPSASPSHHEDMHQDDVAGPTEEDKKKAAVADPDDWDYTLMSFINEWTKKGDGKDDWLSRVKPHVTSNLYKKLQNTSEDNIPDGLEYSDSYMSKRSDNGNSVVMTVQFKNDDTEYVVGLVYRGAWQVEYLSTK